ATAGRQGPPFDAGIADAERNDRRHVEAVGDVAWSAGRAGGLPVEVLQPLSALVRGAQGPAAVECIEGADLKSAAPARAGVRSDRILPISVGGREEQRVRLEGRQRQAQPAAA